MLTKTMPVFAVICVCLTAVPSAGCVMNRLDDADHTVFVFAGHIAQPPAPPDTRGAPTARRSTRRA